MPEPPTTASALPPMSRPHARIELSAWALLAVPNGVIAGAVSGVLVATVYADGVAGWVLALAVGLVTGAGPLANVSSIIWSRWSRGRDKIRSLAALQAVFASAFLVAAVAPPSPAGLALLAAAVLTARIVWCGVVTIRASLWRANYSRRARTAFVARVQAVVAVIVAVVGAAAGLLLDLDPRAQRWMFLAAAGFCLAGLVALRRLKLRGQRRRLRAELAGGAENTFNLNSLKRILANDPNYRRYLGCLFVLGSGTLMATAPLILVLGRDLSVSAVTQVLITGSLPTLLIPLATPYWSRKLAERHAIAYRALLSRVFVAAAAAALAGATLSWLPLLWLSAALQGIACAGGMLGFSLGHDDFAPEARSVEYLSVHITLAGVRGLTAPLIGAASYTVLEAWRPGAGAWSLALPLALVSAGAVGFARLERHLNASRARAAMP